MSFGAIVVPIPGEVFDATHGMANSVFDTQYCL